MLHNKEEEEEEEEEAETNQASSSASLYDDELKTPVRVAEPFTDIDLLFRCFSNRIPP